MTTLSDLVQVTKTASKEFCLSGEIRSAKPKLRKGKKVKMVPPKVLN